MYFYLMTKTEATRVDGPERDLGVLAAKVKENKLSEERTNKVGEGESLIVILCPLYSEC